MIKLHDKTFVPMFSQAEIDRFIDKLATQINLDFQGKKPIFIGVLNGSFMFVSDLMKKINIDCEVSFIKLSSYEGTSSTGVIHELVGLSTDLTDRHVIVVEDIIDTGNTLGKILDLLEEQETASLSITTLLLKPDVFRKRYPVQYIGKEISNKFVVGYGLDYDELGRNLKEIYQLGE
ncbi:MAG: hypoxanthine phosphoribosyltransferase [Crocinitomicaceae bacterium]|nr:hypoxanthine phosphoribosyltransferase [Crocinitomicaceae bacterium]